MSDVAAAGASINDLLERVVELGGSDLHLTSGAEPLVRINGELKRLTEHPRLTSQEIQRLLAPVLKPHHHEVFESTQELDLGYGVEGLGRFRVNVFYQRGSVGTVMRVIPSELRAFDELGLPETVGSFADLSSGLVLVSGPAGSGKSTTLAALLDRINRSRPAHVMTIEDPIEFLHRHNQSIINQREVGQDTRSFAEALRHVLRQDPDVILVGELPDAETIRTALMAAETGHLVLAALHAQDARQAVERISDMFAADQQQHVRFQLGNALAGVVTQQLVPRANRLGRTVAAEVLVVDADVRRHIREGDTDRLPALIAAANHLGMQTMEQSLAEQVLHGVITLEVAVERTMNGDEVRRLVGDALIRV
jgi:twitching motility protein PilT